MLSLSQPSRLVPLPGYFQAGQENIIMCMFYLHPSKQQEQQLLWEHLSYAVEGPPALWSLMEAGPCTAGVG